MRFCDIDADTLPRYEAIDFLRTYLINLQMGRRRSSKGGNYEKENDCSVIGDAYGRGLPDRMRQQ